MAGEKTRCRRCNLAAVYLNRETGEHLCKGHLMADVEHRTMDRLCSSGPLGDTIGVAFSGGKDSTALLRVLAEKRTILGISLVALTVDEGIGGYREDTIQAARKICSLLEVEHQILSFQEAFGSSLDHLVSHSTRKPCTICGILRRRALEIMTKNTGVQILVTGHNQDDAAQTAVMNAISGDVRKVFAGTGTASGFAHRIKPFARVSEREVTLYAILSGPYHDLPECPYATTSLRGEVRTLLNQYEQKHPGSMKNAAICEEQIRNTLGSEMNLGEYQKCVSCGWPSAAEKCQVCEILGR